MVLTSIGQKLKQKSLIGPSMCVSLSRGCRTIAGTSFNPIHRSRGTVRFITVVAVVVGAAALGFSGVAGVAVMGVAGVVIAAAVLVVVLKLEVTLVLVDVGLEDEDAKVGARPDATDTDAEATEDAARTAPTLRRPP